jgi:uncharacterized protein
MSLPAFRYHPDPIKTGSIEASDETCICCKKPRGYMYAGPLYTEKDLDNSVCPWCIADGSAHKKVKAEFVDAEAFPDQTPRAAITEITQRTPGYNAWQTEVWPACCNDATAFLGPHGITEIRKEFYEREGEIMTFIVQEMHISGSAAARLLNSLQKDQGPTLFLFQCLHCQAYRFHIDEP